MLVSSKLILLMHVVSNRKTLRRTPAWNNKKASDVKNRAVGFEAKSCNRPSIKPLFVDLID